MEYVEIAGMRASRLGFGCAAIGGHDYGPTSDEESVRAVTAALDAGVTLFDVADIYGLGHAEAILSEGLGERRKDVVIATKFGVAWDADRRRTFRDISPKHLREALEASLRRLRIDCIPLYQVHWPDGKTPVDETLEALIRCREAGKIRAIGLSNFDPFQHDKAIRRYRIEAMQLPFNLVDTGNRALFEYGSERLGMLTVAYNVLAHGFLTGEYTPDSKFQEPDLRARNSSFLRGPTTAKWRLVDTLRTVAEQLGSTPAQVAIRWTLNQQGVRCVLAGARDESQARRNAEAAGTLLPADISARLDAAAGSLPGGEAGKGGGGPRPRQEDPSHARSE